MNFKFSDSTVAILGVLTVIAVYGLAGTLDASDFETDIERERREWAYAIQHCHRAFGPQTAPEYNDRGMLVCVGARGQVYEVAKQ